MPTPALFVFADGKTRVALQESASGEPASALRSLRRAENWAAKRLESKLGEFRPGLFAAEFVAANMADADVRDVIEIAADQSWQDHVPPGCGYRYDVTHQNGAICLDVWRVSQHMDRWDEALLYAGPLSGAVADRIRMREFSSGQVTN